MESNHRHADFQYGGEARPARGSRRSGRDFCFADRTAPPDRAHPEPEAWKPALFLERPNAVNGLGASRPNRFRTARRTGPSRGPGGLAPGVPKFGCTGSGRGNLETWQPGNLRALGPAEIGRLPGFEIARLSPYRPAAATQRGREVKKKYGYRKDRKAPSVTASPAQQAIVCRRRGGVS